MENLKIIRYADHHDQFGYGVDNFSIKKAVKKVGKTALSVTTAPLRAVGAAVTGDPYHVIMKGPIKDDMKSLGVGAIVAGATVATVLTLGAAAPSLGAAGAVAGAATAVKGVKSGVDMSKKAQLVSNAREKVNDLSFLSDAATVAKEVYIETGSKTDAQTAEAIALTSGILERPLTDKEIEAINAEILRQKRNVAIIVAVVIVIIISVWFFAIKPK